MRWSALALVAATACATGREAAAPEPSPFRNVRTLVLVRAVDDRGHRGRDPLDGLAETLRARGYEARVIDLGPGRAADLAELEQLFARLELRASASRAERIARPFTSAGGEAGVAVAALGVDAVASYHRLDRPPRGDLAPPGPGRVLSPGPAPPVRPAGALALVDRAGTVATFAWGDAAPHDDPALPVNAAEAIDLLVRALAGDAALE
jgi:hypothetical protein